MLNRVFLALAFMLPAFAAFGADMAIRKAPAQPVIRGCNWCGFTLGLHVGYGWSRSGFGGVVAEEFELGTLEPSGIMFGGQAGHLWQWGAFVAGLEASGSYWGHKKSAALEVGELAVLTNTIELQYTAAVRAVLGMEIGAPFLVYVTGGPAFAHAEGTLQSGATVLTAPANHFGWELGGGVKTKFGDSLIFGVEALWADYGKSTYSFGGGLDTPGRLQAGSVRARFDIKLN